MSALVGKTLNGRYRVEEYIGGGGMADVYKVWDVRRSCYLAVKVMRQSLNEFEEFGERFKREAEVLERLQHPNIVRFYGFEQDKETGTTFIIMDYVDGPTLATKLKTSRHPLSTHEMVPLIDDIAAALAYAHEHGIIHRDIKPSNILISRDGRGLLSDFGIARLADAMTMTYHGIGTPAYMSPEHCEGKDLTGASDVYSLGVVLYESLAGRRPFVGELNRGEVPTSASIMREHVEMPPPSPSEINPAIRPEVEAVLFRCLAKEPQYRYQSAADLANELHRASGIKVVPALRVSSIPGGADVTIDGRPAGVTPLEIASMQPGRHTIRVALKGYREYTQAIQTPEQGAVEVRLEATPPPAAPTPPPVTPPPPPPTVRVSTPTPQPVPKETMAGGTPPPRQRPPTTTGDGGDSRKPPWLLFGLGAAIVGVAAMAVLVLLLMGGGGGDGDDGSNTPTPASGSSTATRSPTPTPRASAKTPTATPGEATPPVGTPLGFSGQIAQPDAVRTHQFQGKADDVVTIVMRQDGSASLNVFVTLLDPAGEEIDSEGCDSSASEARLLNVPLAADGRYTIQAEGCNGTTGKYVIALEKKPPVATLVYGEEVTGVIDLSRDYEDWFFDGSDGDIVTVQVIRDGSASLTSYLRLYDPGDAEVTTDGCNGGTGESTIQNQPLAFTGRFRLRVEGCNSTTGAFRMTITLKPAARQLPYGSSAEGTIRITKDYEEFRFTGQQGDVVTIQAQRRLSASLTSFVRLFDPGGVNEVEDGCNGNTGEARIQNHTLKFSGEYTIRVYGCNNTTGDYTVTNTKE